MAMPFNKLTRMYRISNVNGKGKTSSIAVDLDSKRQFLLQAIIDAND